MPGSFSRRDALKLGGAALVGLAFRGIFPGTPEGQQPTSESVKEAGKILEADAAMLDRFLKSNTVNRGDIEGLTAANLNGFVVEAEGFQFNFVELNRLQDADQVFYVELSNASNTAVKSWYSMTGVQEKMRLDDMEVDSTAWKIGKNTVIEYPTLKTQRSQSNTGLVFNAPYYVPNFFMKWPDGMPLSKDVIPPKVLAQLD